MRITAINPSNPNFEGAKIEAKQNKHVKFLYNKVLDMVQQDRMPATFATDYIELPTTTKQTLEKLKKLGIKYIETTKKEK